MAEMSRQEMYPNKNTNWAVDMGKHAVESLVILGLETFTAAFTHLIKNLPSPKDSNEQA